MGLPTDPNLVRYLRQVQKQHSDLDMSLFQAGQEQDFSFVSLNTFYIPLRIAGKPPLTNEEDTRRKRPEAVADESLYSNQLLHPRHRLSRHLTLLGDAGSGKTTLLRHLVGELAHACLGGERPRLQAATGWSSDPLIPLFVPLRHFHHYCGQRPQQPVTRRAFFNFLAHYFAEYEDLPLPPDFYRQLLEGGQSFLVLDGFDEVPGEMARRQVLGVVRQLAQDEAIGQNRIILSSRVAAYGGPTQLGGQFQTLWVQDLNREERQQQIEKWFAGIRPYTQRQLRVEDVLRRMAEGDPLDRLAVTPMIVTALCVVYFYDHELPEERARLYRRCVDIMLYEKLRADEPGGALARLAGEPDFKRELLARLAYALHESGLETTDKEQAALWLKDGFKSQEEEARLPAARQFLDVMTERGTLLQERDGAFGFFRQHLTFREFLVGYHLGLNLRAKERRQLWPQLVLADRWREAVRLAVGATMPDHAVTCEQMLEELLEAAQEAGASAAQRMGAYRLAAESLLDLGEKARRRIERALQEQICQGVAGCLADPAVTDPTANLLKVRVAAAAALGRLGDPRTGVVTLPPRLTEHALGGSFKFGANGESRTIATPFQAGIYPVTNAQFQAFMDAGGYENRGWWSADGLKWLDNPPSYRSKSVRAPEYWGNTILNQSNQPVVGVTQYEAEAFCAWLTATYGRAYRLPTEEEWECLARGSGGRVYPWGNEWRDGVCNTKESGLGAPCAVGLFPDGVSPTGAQDCAGNVWEWYLESGRLKGGSWANDKDAARCWARLGGSPDHSSDFLGFRVVAPIS